MTVEPTEDGSPARPNQIDLMTALFGYDAYESVDQDHEFLSPRLREDYQRKKASREGPGWAKSILIVLEVRRVAFPDEIRKRILGCRDLDQLRVWLLRAVTATTIDNVIRE
jgi:hypothetical protein